MVEHKLPKLGVAGSSPVARSKWGESSTFHLFFFLVSALAMERIVVA